MSKTLTETATFTANIVVPVDGDARNAASVETPFQSLANRTKYLNNYGLRAAFNTTECTDATKNIDATVGEIFKVPANLTANRVYKLINGASLPAGTIRKFYRATGASVSNCTINAGSASIIFATTQPAHASFLWDGSDWHCFEWAETAVTACQSLTTN